MTFKTSSKITYLKWAKLEDLAYDIYQLLETFLPMKVEEANPSLPDVRCQKFAFQAAITRPRKSIFIVTGTNDSSAGSLHDAITQANNTAGADTIDFDNFILDGRTKGIL